MELRQLQLQLTDLKFSGRKDEPEDWSPGHWAGYGWMWCDVATPPSFNNSMVPWWFGNRNSLFQLREVLWIAMSQRKRIGFEMLPLVWMKIASMLIVWLHWLLCVCVGFSGWWCPRSIPFWREGFTPSQIYQSGRVGVIIMFFLIQDELLPMKKTCDSLFQNHTYILYIYKKKGRRDPNEELQTHCSSTDLLQNTCRYDQK